MTTDGVDARDVRALRERYEKALFGFREEGGEKWLQDAHGLGRQAIKLGLGVLDVVTMHADAAGAGPAVCGAEFLREALSPFEMTHRGFAEANSELRALNESLQRLVDERTEDLRQRQRLSEALNEINDLTRSGKGSEVIMYDVLAKGAETIGAASGSVAVAEGEEWVVRYVWGSKPNIVGRRFDNERNPWTRLAVERGKPVVTEDAQWNSRLALREDVRTDGSTIVAPIVVRGHTVAVLHFNHEPPPRTLSRAEIDFVEKLASSLSLALRDVLSFEAEHRIAEVLQEAILETPSEIEGLRLAVSYASSTEQARVGGDFYDVFGVQEGQVCFLIGDVSGKGIEAASVAAMTKHTIRVHAVPARAPRDILRLTNESMRRFTPPDTFITLFLGLLDVGTGEFRYAGGGHPPGILIRADGTVGFLPMKGASGPLLGAFPGMEYCDRSLVLDCGDLVVLYTDGAAEARRGPGLLGEEGFRDLLRPGSRDDPSQLLGYALEDVKRWSGGTLSDDIALLAVRFEGPAC